MKGEISAKEHFRKGFVLIMTLAYAIVFLALIGGFLEALLLAAVFSGIVYPMYLWFQNATGNRKSLASLLTMVVSLLLIIVPLLFLLALVAEQALGLTETVKPWFEDNIHSSSLSHPVLPDWFPFADKLAPYTEEISTKLSELISKTSVLVATSLAKISEGAAIFFLNLFVMLYAMYFFLISGPAIMDRLFSYVPLRRVDKDKMINVGLSVSRATVKGSLIIGVIQGVLGGLSFAVAGLGSAAFYGAVMAVLSILPGIGAMLVWGPAVVYLFITGKTIAGVGLLLWCAGVVGSVDNFLRPILVGRDSQMSDLLILLSTLGGLALFGASGLVLGPILAALFLTVLTIYSQVFADWLQLDGSISDSLLVKDSDSSVATPDQGD